METDRPGVAGARLERATSIFAMRALAMAVVVLIPLQIVALGHLPDDDALRHAAKAVSGKDWSQILVLRPDIVMDSHPGWHALLGAVHRSTGADAHALVLFSVITLFIAFALAPLALLRRPEGWLLSLLVLAVADPGLLMRLVQGRPLLLSMAVLAVACLFWPRLREPGLPWTGAVALTLLLAAATWIHGSWYLFGLLLLAFLMAREWRASRRLAACLALGVLLGASLTGRPLLFLAQAVQHAWLALGSGVPVTSLAVEFQPFLGSPLMVVAVLAMLGARALQGNLRREVVDNPVFMLAALGWVLGYVAIRFWSDWGLPALLVWLALELQATLDESGLTSPRARLLLTGAAALTVFLATSSDAQGRWSGTGRQPSFLGPLSTRNGSQAPWLPEPGGIFYTADMRLFYRTFYRNPDAPWRYVVGFEPGLMPPEDLAVYHGILAGGGNPEAYSHWVEKMRPQDRLFVIHVSDSPPPIAGLEWHPVLRSLWSGRLPRPGPAGAAQ